MINHSIVFVKHDSAWEEKQVPCLKRGSLETFGQVILYCYSFDKGAWLYLLPDGRFNAHPDVLRHLHYVDDETLTTIPSEDLLPEFHDPEGVQEVLKEYLTPKSHDCDR